MMQRLFKGSESTLVVPDFLRPFHGLALGIIDSEGQLVDANQGFYDLLAPEGAQLSPSGLLLNPTLGELLARSADASDDLIYTGPMTLGDVDGDPETWLGRVYRRDDVLLIACEPDLQQERNLRRQLIALTEEYSEKERQLARANRDLTHYAGEVERLSLTDWLTDLPNRRQFEQFMEHHVEQAERHGEPLGLLMLDIDRFKRINDELGHQAGDDVLHDMAATLAEHVRGADVLARWGGEEFVVLAPKTTRDGAFELAERLRNAVAAMPARVADLPAITISIGVAERCDGESGADLLGRADAALQRAKEHGRNRTLSA